MTLKEKFLPKMYCYLGSGMLSNTYDENIALQNAKECEQIANDYAIEFAEWSFWLKRREYEGQMEFYYNDKPNTTKELLEIFKKEKGYE